MPVLLDDARALNIAPVRSRLQRLDALHKANGVRSERAQLKRDVAARRASVVNVLVDPPEFVLSMKVLELLMAMPRWGSAKGKRALNEMRMSHSRTVGGLTPRQRLELANLITSKLKGPVVWNG